jgi:hypothetical protein
MLERESPPVCRSAFKLVNPRVLALIEIPEGPSREPVVKEFQLIPLATKLAVPPVEEYDPVA